MASRATNVIKPSPCKHCGDVFSSSGKLANHVPRCPMREGMREQLIESLRRSSGHPQSEETRQKISIARSRAIEELGRGGYRHVKWYRVKNLRGEEWILRGQLEVSIAELLNTEQRYWRRGVTLEYVNQDGNIRRYTPDFVLPDEDLMIEAKGFFSDVDRRKLDAVCERHNVNLAIVFKPWTRGAVR